MRCDLWRYGTWAGDVRRILRHQGNQLYSAIFTTTRTIRCNCMYVLYPCHLPSAPSNGSCFLPYGSFYLLEDLGLTDSMIVKCIFVMVKAVYIQSLIDTPGHVHVITLGANDVFNLLGASSRYGIGQILQESGAFGKDVYKDPVPFEKVFEIVDSVPQLISEPLITVSVSF